MLQSQRLSASTHAFSFIRRASLEDGLNLAQFIEMSTEIEVPEHRVLDAISTAGRQCGVPIVPVDLDEWKLDFTAGGVVYNIR